MTLLTLQASLQKYGVACSRRRDGSLVWPVRSNFGAYPVIFSEEQHGWVQGRVIFPLPKLARPQDLVELIVRCNAYDNVSVALSRNKREIVVSTFADEGGVTQAAQQLAAVADRVSPISNHLLEHGSWDKWLVMFSFYPEDVFAGGRH